MRAQLPPNEFPLACVALVCLGLIVWVPPLVGFSVAVGGAIGWSLWVERHPSA